MKKIIGAILILLVASNVSGQKSSNYMKKMPKQDGALYFIKPQKFESNKKGVEFEADFTYNYDKNKPNTGLVINFSLFTKAPVRNFKGLTITKVGATVPVCSVDSAERFYCEKGKSKWDNRYSCAIPPQALIDMLSDVEHYQITISYDTESVTVRYHSKLKNDLFVVGQSIEIETGLKGQ